MLQVLSESFDSVSVSSTRLFNNTHSAGKTCMYYCHTIDDVGVHREFINQDLDNTNCI